MTSPALLERRLIAAENTLERAIAHVRRMQYAHRVLGGERVLLDAAIQYVKDCQRELDAAETVCLQRAACKQAAWSVR